MYKHVQKLTTQCSFSSPSRFSNPSPVDTGKFACKYTARDNHQLHNYFSAALKSKNRFTVVIFEREYGYKNAGERDG